MTPAMAGLLGGTAFGLANFGILRWIADRAERAKPTVKQKKVAGVIRLVAWTYVMIFLHSATTSCR